MKKRKNNEKTAIQCLEFQNSLDEKGKLENNRQALVALREKKDGRSSTSLESEMDC